MKLPAGFVGNPSAVPTCPQAKFAAGVPFQGRLPGVRRPRRSARSCSGATLPSCRSPRPSSIWSPAPTNPLSSASGRRRAAIILRPSIRTGEDYGLTVKIPDSSQGLPVVGSELSFWGVPGDPGHDLAREEVKLAPFEGTVQPFLSNPTSCTGPVLTTLRMNSWQEPGNYQEASFLSHNAAMEPVGADGCEKLSFEPSRSTCKPDPPGAAQPTALSATLHLPQHNKDPNGLVTAHLKKAVVKLPQGVAVNPAAANGLGSCSEAQFGYHNADPVSCPSDSRVGLGEVVTPAARRPAQGLDLPRPAERQPVRQPAGRLHGGLGARGDGQDRRQDRHRPQQRPGHRDLRRKPAAAVQRLQAGLLRRPRRRPGQPERLRRTRPTPAPSLLVGGDSEHHRLVHINQNCSTGGFNPGFSAGSTNPSGGSLRAVRARRDPQRRRTERLGDRRHPAEGRGRRRSPACRSARPQTRPTGSCPAASQVGTVSVAAGAGPNPVWVPQPGKAPTAAYLSGPYKGAALQPRVQGAGAGRALRPRHGGGAGSIGQRQPGNRAGLGRL